MSAPLRKKNLAGVLYTRTAEIEAKLTELAALSRDELTARAAIPRRDDPLYVPSECLIHFVRASRDDNSDAQFERLYKLLAERVLKALPRSESKDGETASNTRGSIKEKAFGRFAELIAADRGAYSDKLDYFEIRFDGAVASLRRDAQDQAWREENRKTALEFDAETGEPSPEVERAAGSFNPFEAEKGYFAYRSGLDAAIRALPPEQSRIIEMLRQGIPIDSKDPTAITIAKTLGRSEKHVRIHRDKALVSLRGLLTKGEGS